MTSTRFTRDIRLFLASLVGFLIFIIAALLLWLHQSVQTASAAERANQETIARIVAAELERLPDDASDAILVDRLTYLSGAYAVPRMEIVRNRSLIAAAGDIPENEAVIERDTRRGLLRLLFQPATFISQRNFILVQAIVIAATIGGTILFFLYLPRIIRPFEQLVAHARDAGDRDESFDESRNLIETFRRTIDTMRNQEVELKRLHEIDRQRANDLEAVTATLTRSLTTGFLAIDDSMRMVDLNMAGREILDVDPSQPVAGKPLQSVFHTAVADTIERAARERKHVNRAEVELRGKLGPKLIGLSVVPVFQEQGAFLGALALFSDLTPIRTLESRVREMQTLADLGEIAAGIAHEFRNSLSTILGYLRLSERAADESTAAAKIVSARAEAEQLLEAVNRLLAFSRPVQLDRTEVDLLDLASDVAARAAVSGDNVRIDVDGTPVVISADRALLSRALENVIRNAIESIGEKGERGEVAVRVSADPVPTIVVRDNGVGVSPDDVPRLFLPFQSNRSSGFGLGLPLARKIVLLHDGTISLTGQPGAGAEVRIEFHASPAAASD